MLVHFKDAGRMTADELPAVGSEISAVVLGHKELEHQIVLSVRPMDLRVISVASGPHVALI
jgi:hypothetical protein